LSFAIAPARSTCTLLNDQDYLYDLNGNLTSLTDRRGFETTFAYDLLDRRTTRTNPLTDAETFAYDARDNLVTFTTAKGDPITSVYDDLNRPTGTTTPDNVLAFTYDAASNMLTAADDDSDLSFSPCRPSRSMQRPAALSPR
jgi:YD repeat-containing protein